jgi:hypothetical protein
MRSSDGRFRGPAARHAGACALLLAVGLLLLSVASGSWTDFRGSGPNPGSITSQETHPSDCSGVALAHLATYPAAVNISPLQDQMFTADAESACGTPITQGVSFSWWLSSDSLGLLNSSNGPLVAYSACLAPMAGILHVEAKSSGISLFANSSITVTLQNPGWQDPSSNSSAGTLGGSGSTGAAGAREVAAVAVIVLLGGGAVAVVLYGRRRGGPEN